MTAVCPGGGASSQKPGIGNSVVISASLISGGLALISPWLIPVAALLDGFVFEALAECGNDPPAMPTWDASDITNLIGGVLNPNYQTSLSKLSDTVQNYVWYQFCQCNGGAPTTPFRAPVPPPSLTVPSPTGGSVCYTASWSGPTDDSHDNLLHYNAAAALWPGTDTTINLGGVTTPVRDLATPLPASVSATVTVHYPDSTTRHVVARMWAFNSANAVVGTTPNVTVPFVANGDSTITFSRDIPSTTKYLMLDVFDDDATYHAATADAQTQWYCAGSSSTVPSTPCPTDPSTLMLLQQIWNMVQLIQRQAVPFAYVPSTVHAGLSGAGSLSVSALLGAKVDITTLPDALGRSGSNPMEIFDAGWITFGTPDGYPSSYRLEHDPTLLLPARCSAYTTLDYDLHPGVVITITELLREP